MWPIYVANTSVYSGDPVLFLNATITAGDPPETLDTLDEWTDWKAYWRYSPDSSDFVELDVAVDVSTATIVVKCSGEVSASLKSSGVWDLQAKKDGEVRTWFRGSTDWVLDVTR